MMQVMTNLLGNAIKYSPSGGSITVKAQVKDSELLVQVGDHGTGIPKKAIPHVFEKFYRAKDSMAVGGTGLGLYITKQIIEAHGGRIWVESKPNKGATFYFTIPKPTRKKTKRIGEILVEDGFISPKDLEKVLNKQAGLEVEPSGG
jgi:signal transduction histidine kinase